MPPLPYFPAVMMSSMSEMYMNILKRHIRRDSEQILEMYALLRTRGLCYLCDTYCPVENLLVCIMDVRHVKRLSRKSPLIKLQNETTISGVFLEMVVKDLISYIQFSIVRRVTTHLCSGSEELQDKLIVYEERLGSYMRRRICETYIYHDGRFGAFVGREAEEKVELLITTDENWDDNTRYQKVVDMEAILADYLNIEDFGLELVAVELHCLRLRYALYICIAQSVFPLTDEEWNGLSHHGITKMQCMGYFYTTEDEGMFLTTLSEWE